MTIVTISRLAKVNVNYFLLVGFTGLCTANKTVKSAAPFILYRNIMQPILGWTNKSIINKFFTLLNIWTDGQTEVWATIFYTLRDTP